MNRLRASLFSSVLKQEVAFFDKTRTGELINRLSADAALLGRSVTENLSDGLRAGAPGSPRAGCGGLGPSLWEADRVRPGGISVLWAGGLGVMVVQAPLNPATCGPSQRRERTTSPQVIAQQLGFPPLRQHQHFWVQSVHSGTTSLESSRWVL